MAQLLKINASNFIFYNLNVKEHVLFLMVQILKIILNHFRIANLLFTSSIFETFEIKIEQHFDFSLEK